MDKLKLLLQATKPKSKIVEQKKVLEEKQKRLQEERDEDVKRQKELKDKKLREMEDFYGYEEKRKKVKVNQDIEEFSLTADEIKTKLRALQQPITLFAQSTSSKYQRLLKAEEFIKNNPDFDMKTYDQKFQQRLKEQQQFNQLDIKYRTRMIEPKLGDDPLNIQRKKQMIKKEEESISFEQMCDELVIWIYKLARDWSQALEQKYSLEERDNNRDSFARFSESEQDIRSFVYVLKKRGGDKDMIRAVYYIMNCCLIRQYIMANDRYIDLSIGNAPWPLGIANLSITVKRNGPKVSHVLNDQTTRKWMQSVKRFITVSQEIYPSPDDFRKVGYSFKGVI